MTKEKSLQDLEEIKNIMNKSTRFSSISGLSGIFAGIYLLMGALVYYLLIDKNVFEGLYFLNIDSYTLFTLLILFIVFLMSIITLAVLTVRKAKKTKEKAWNHSSKRLFINFCIPFLSGIVFLFLTLGKIDPSLTSSLILIFYGLTLVNGAKYTLGDLRSLGILEIITGLINVLLPAYSFWIFIFGFGILNIVYGCVLHFKYDRI